MIAARRHLVACCSVDSGIGDSGSPGPVAMPAFRGLEFATDRARDRHGHMTPPPETLPAAELSCHHDDQLLRALLAAPDPRSRPKTTERSLHNCAAPSSGCQLQGSVSLLRVWLIAASGEVSSAFLQN
jgi:hypothetical protein